MKVKELKHVSCEKDFLCNKLINSYLIHSNKILLDFFEFQSSNDKLVVIDVLDRINSIYQTMDQDIFVIVDLFQLDFLIHYFSKDLSNKLLKIKLNNCLYWKINNELFNVSDHPLIYGILNITPDSFYDGGQYFSPKDVYEHINKMILAGTDIIEIGGQSTRPGYDEISVEEEKRRTIPVIKYIKHNFPKVLLAIDSYKEDVIYSALNEDVDIVNDIHGFDTDEKVHMLANSNAGMVLMHYNRTQNYTNVTNSIINFFKKRLGYLSEQSIDFSRVILDPGVGFLKIPDKNDDLTIMNNVSRFVSSLNRPIMTAISRKGFIEQLFGLDKDDRLPSTLVAESYMFLQGSNIIRVHDINETKQLIKLLDTIRQSY